MSRAYLPLAALFAIFALGAADASAATSARADFNGDGFADLAVGAPIDSVGGDDLAGAVNVIYGSPEGLRQEQNQQFTQDEPGLDAAADRGNRFGASVAAGDLNGDGFGDLVIGVPGDTVAGGTHAGLVHILYGSSGGLTLLGNRLVTQNTPGVPGSAETAENFGHALAVGDFDADGNADVAVGVRDESIRGVRAAGAVNVLYGAAAGLADHRSQLWHQDTPGVLATAGAFDRFGFALAAGDLDGDGVDDLAAGVPGERIRGAAEAGAVNVLFGSSAGLSADRDQLWSQGAIGIRGTPQRGDNFGRSLATADFNGDGRGDLAVGVPFEDLRRAREAGVANVIFGSTGGLTAAGSELWHQNSNGVPGRAERVDRFGSALAAGDLSRNGAAELVAGVPNEGVRGRPGAGAVNVFYGRVDGLTANPARIWHQGTPGIIGAVERFDRLGSALLAADFDNDGAGDIAIGAPGESIGTVAQAGAVNVIRGSTTGLDSAGNQIWHQATPGIQGTRGPDGFGGALATGPPSR